MAQLSQDQIKRMGLGVLGLIIGVGGFWMLMLQPQMDNIEKMRGDISALESQISKGKAAITGAEALAMETAEQMEIYEQILDTVPSGAPIAWFPPRVNNYWRLQGFSSVSTSPSGTQPHSDPALNNFQILDWAVTLSNAPFVEFGIALAEFENREILMQIEQMRIVAGGAEPENQNIDFSFGLVLPNTGGNN